MLFTQHVNTLNSGITAIQNRIDELEAILKGLRNDKSNLEAELQQILTLEGAAESAINQAQMFVNAAESLNRDDLISTFWQAMDAMKTSVIAQLPEATPDPEPIPEPDPTPEPESESEIITVEATESPEPTPEPSYTWGNQNGKTPQPQSVGSAAFDTKTATLEELKAYVRSFWSDDKIKQHGSLTRRSTWVMAAKQITNISDYTPQA